MDTGLELLMKPIEHAPLVAALDLSPRFANGHGALPLVLQARPLFLQKDVGQQSQRLEAHDGEHTHQLIVIQPQLLFAVSEEDFNLPPAGQVREQGEQIGFQVTGGPVARLRQWRIEQLADDDHLTLIQLAHARLHDMHVDLLRAARPLHALIVAFLQLRRIVRQALPPPALLRRLVLDTQPPIALQPHRDKKAALTCRFPQRFGAVPAIEQDVRAGASQRFKVADACFHQGDLALKGHTFRLAGALLAVEVWRQGTTALQQDIGP